MELNANDNELRRALEDEGFCKRRYGTAMTKKLRLRLDALRAADSLADFWPPKSGPERCHELKGDRVGVFSVDLKQPYRLLFVSTSSPPMEGEGDEQERWKTITSINIVAIEDTHG